MAELDLPKGTIKSIVNASVGNLFADLKTKEGSKISAVAVSPTRSSMIGVLATASKAFGIDSLPKVRALASDVSSAIFKSLDVETKEAIAQLSISTNKNMSAGKSTIAGTKGKQKIVDEYTDKRNLAAGYNCKANTPARIEIRSEGKTEVIEDILLQSVTIQFGEKTQNMAMLDDTNMIYFFGGQAVTVGFVGVCLDSYNFQWLTNLAQAYRNKMRGTQSISKGTRIVVAYDDREIEGFVMSFTCSKRSNNVNIGEISFSMVANRMDTLTDIEKEEEEEVKGQYTGSVTQTVTEEANNSIKDRITKAVGANLKLKNPTTDISFKLRSEENGN